MLVQFSFNPVLGGRQSAALVAMAMMLSGCASSSTKLAADILNRSEVAYGRVISVRPLDAADAASACGKEQTADEQSAYICANWNQYEAARVAFWHIDTRMMEAAATVPKSDHIKERYILQLNPRKGAARYQQIASTDDTNDCRWIGLTPEFLNGGTGVATGFLAGVLIVPGVILLSTDALSAGVECRGWSYTKIINESRNR